MKQDYIIWNSEIEDVDSCDWSDEDFNEFDYNDKCNYLAEENNELLYWYRKYKLNIDVDEDIVAIAKIRFWNCSKMGYKIVGENLSKCFDVADSIIEDNVKYFCDKYNFCCTTVNHDGGKNILFRKFKKNLSETQKENFLNKVFYGKATKKDISRYTESIRNLVMDNF